MEIFIILLLILLPKCELLKPKPTIPIEERIEYIKNEMQRTLLERGGLKVQPIADSYEDEDSAEYEDRPRILPINEKDVRKRDGKFGLKKIKTEPTTSSGESDTTISQLTPMVIKEAKPRNIQKHVDDETETSFFRRAMDPEVRTKPMPWIHCHDMFRPFMSCQKTGLSDFSNITFGNHEVTRLISLLRLNTTTYTNDDIYAIMVQLSNIKIKFFQWDALPLRVLINVIILENSTLDKKVNFPNIKSGLKNIFMSWGLDFGNTTNLLKAAKVFRPPCLPALADKFSSTKSSKIKTKHMGLKTTTKKACPEGKNCLF